MPKPRSSDIVTNSSNKVLMTNNNSVVEANISGLTFDGTTLAPSGGLGGSTGLVDNSLLRADGVGEASLQSSPATISDSGLFNIDSQVNSTIRIVDGSGQAVSIGRTLFDGGGILRVYNNAGTGLGDIYAKEVRAYNSAETEHISISHSGSNGIIWSKAGELRLAGGDGSAYSSTVKINSRLITSDYIYDASLGYFFSNNRCALKSTSPLQWADSNVFSTIDVGVGRVATGVIQVHNGTAGNYRDVHLRELRAYGSSAVNYGYIKNDDTDSIIGTSANRFRIRTKSNFDFTFSDDTVTPSLGVPNNGYLITNRISGQSSQGSLTRGSATGSWKITGNLDSGGGVWTSPPTTPSSGITENINNYNPGLGWYFRIQSSGTVNITGLSISQTDGQPAELWNVGDNDIILKYQDTNSTTTNRFICIPSGDITLGKDDIAMLRYDGTTQRWRVSKA